MSSPFVYSQALESLLEAIRGCKNILPDFQRALAGGTSADMLNPAYTDEVIDLIRALPDSTRADLEVERRRILASGETLVAAKPMFWSKPVAELVWHASTQLDFNFSFSLDLLYCESAWCWLEQPRQSPGYEAYKGQADWPQPEWVAISWAWAQDQHGVQGVAIIGWTDDSKEGFKRFRYSPQCSLFVKDGRAMGEHDFDLGESADELALIRFVVSAGAFLRSKLSATEPHQAHRQARKAARAQKKSEAASLIEVVMLRQKDRGENRQTDSHIEWQHQWIVGAHTRQQWYPSKEKHLPIIVSAYLKGPAGKPLKAPASKVFAVTR